MAILSHLRLFAFPRVLGAAQYTVGRAVASLVGIPTFEFARPPHGAYEPTQGIFLRDARWRQTILGFVRFSPPAAHRLRKYMSTKRTETDDCVGRAPGAHESLRVASQLNL